MRQVIACLVVAVMGAGGAAAQDSQPKSIGERTRGLQKIDGYVPLYWDAKAGKMLMEIGRFNTELLYQISLPAGIGSNPIGLDRGQLGNGQIVVFERVGPKVLMVQPNHRYRARSEDAAERRAVEDSFARSVLWGFTVEATEGERVLVDATPFFIRDAHGVVDRLRQTQQGRYKMDESRSAFHLPRTKGFPRNTEVETTITFTTEEDPGRLVRQVSPTPQAVTVRQHHSFVELPDDNYRPRRLDPRVGAFGITFYDYATPFTEPIEQRWIARHRLEKKDPSASISEPVKPIVYYVDNGAPEPIRSALIEGASWWNQAFEAAGFRNAFRVEVLPDDADPMDARYHMISWVHRSTRGWSYGGSITDPRTGEIIKGNVTLGSLRVRQDYLLGTALVPIHGGSVEPGAVDVRCEMGMLPADDYLQTMDPSVDAAAMSLARIRQLSAHEVGHTLGFAHNFAASTYGRASVLDYPAPMVEITDGRLDLSRAYAAGMGDYDIFVTRYSYTQFPPGSDEQAALRRMVEEGVAEGYLFISDADARPPGAAHPLANLWDNGEDPVARLRHELEVRRIAMDAFGLDNIPEGTPLSALEAKFLPLYLHHRYQLQAAVKSVGGASYSYAVKAGSGTSPSQVIDIVPPARQKAALDAVLATIEPATLKVPNRILDLMPPPAFAHTGGTQEYFEKRTAPIFDPIGAATIAADLAVSALLQHERAARLITFNRRDPANPSFSEVASALVDKAWATPPRGDAYAEEIQKAVQWLVVNRLMDLAANADTMPQVRAAASDTLRSLKTRVGTGSPSLTEEIDRFLRRPDPANRKSDPLPTPAGDPIGGR